MRCVAIWYLTAWLTSISLEATRVEPPSPSPLYPPLKRAETTHNKSTNSWKLRCTSLTDGVGRQHGVYLTSDVVLCPRCPTSTSLALALLLFDVLSLIGTLDDAGVGWLLMLPLLWLVRVRVAALIHTAPPFLSPAKHNTIQLTHTHAYELVHLACVFCAHTKDTAAHTAASSSSSSSADPLKQLAGRTSLKFFSERPRDVAPSTLFKSKVHCCLWFFIFFFF